MAGYFTMFLGMYLFIYLFGAKKADRFTVVIESMQSLFGKSVVNVHSGYVISSY